MPRIAQDGLNALFAPDAPLGLGPSRFRPPEDNPDLIRIPTKSARQLKAVVSERAPKLPGVYGMLDTHGRIVYIGKAKSLRSRLLSYFRPDSRDPKAGKIINRTRTLVWEEAHDEFAALLRELELIRRFRPKFNVLGQPGPRRFVYLCIGQSPAPYAYLTREPTGKELAQFGPIIGRSIAQDAVRRLNDYFLLRDCSKRVSLSFADQRDLFPLDRPTQCLRWDLGTCLGPCAGLCSKRKYHDQVRAVRAFLDGKDRSILDDMEAKMAKASDEWQFEKAMAFRDRLKSLNWLHDRLSFLRSARLGGAVAYPLTNERGSTLWYLISGGEVRSVLRAPLNIESIERQFSQPISDVTDKTVDSVILVAAWFKKYREERAKVVTWKGLRKSLG